MCICCVFTFQLDPKFKSFISQPFAMNSCYNYPCTEDPYFSYYSSPLEDHVYQEPFLGPYEVLPSSHEENQAYNNYYQYQSYEVRRHHNSETFYYKTDEELYSTNPENSIDGKLLGSWDEFNYFRKVIETFLITVNIDLF